MIEGLPLWIVILDYVLGMVMWTLIGRFGIEADAGRRVGDYPVATRYQPDEPPLPMTPAHLTAVRDAARARRAPGVHVFDEFVLVNGQGPRTAAAFITRTMRQSLARRLRPR